MVETKPLLKTIKAVTAQGTLLRTEQKEKYTLCVLSSWSKITYCSSRLIFNASLIKLCIKGKG